jgi:hypothetical protein
LNVLVSANDFMHWGENVDVIKKNTEIFPHVGKEIGLK